MRSRNGSSRYVIVAVALAVCLPAIGAASLFAKGAREFAGFYRITQATNQGEMVQLRLSLQVFNYSEADVKDATISLQNSRPQPPGAAPSWESSQPSFPAVVLHVNERKKVSPLESTFTIPVQEYEAWLKGARPPFVIEFQDAAGKAQRRAIELTRMP